MGTTYRTDLYETLGVAPWASAEDLKEAWRKCARRTHPDRAGGSAAEFVKCEHAYDVLSNPLTRREYDERLARKVDDDAQYRVRDDTGRATYGATSEPVYEESYESEYAGPRYEAPVATTERKRWAGGWVLSAGTLFGVYLVASVVTQIGLSAHFGFIRANWLMYSWRGLTGTILLQNFIVALILAPALAWAWHPFARVGKAFVGLALVVMAIATGGLLHGSGLSWKVFLATGALILAARAMAKRAQRDEAARSARRVKFRANSASVVRWGWKKFRGSV